MINWLKDAQEAGFKYQIILPVTKAISYPEWNKLIFEAYKWCDAHMQAEDWICKNGYFAFVNAIDAVQFKLIWC